MTQCYAGIIVDHDTRNIGNGPLITSNCPHRHKTTKAAFDCIHKSHADTYLPSTLGVGVWQPDGTLARLTSNPLCSVCGLPVLAPGTCHGCFETAPATELLEIRQGLGMTQNQFADALGISGAYRWNTISRWETCKTPVPKTALKLARTIATDQPPPSA